MRLWWFIVEDLKECWEEVVDMWGDAVWWWKDVSARRGRQKLSRLKEKDEGQATLCALEVSSIKAEVKHIQSETELVKIS